MSRHFSIKHLRFFLTAPAPCPYLAGRRERKVFTALEGPEAPTLNDALTHAGFRRTQGIAYRPACEACNACVSTRAPVARFVETKRWRRVKARNADLVRTRVAKTPTQEQFRLLRRYLDGRHPGGGMNEMSFRDYSAMVEDSSVRTHLVEYRYASGFQAGELAATALVDLLRDGLSLVYSFFSPDEPQRSLGMYVILDHIDQARTAGLPYVYLGYWVKGSPKMHYKAEIQPLQVLRAGAWREFADVFGQP